MSSIYGVEGDDAEGGTSRYLAALKFPDDFSEFQARADSGGSAYGVLKRHAFAQQSLRVVTPNDPDVDVVVPQRRANSLVPPAVSSPDADGTPVPSDGAVADQKMIIAVLCEQSPQQERRQRYHHYHHHDRSSSRKRNSQNLASDVEGLPLVHSGDENIRKAYHRRHHRSYQDLTNAAKDLLQQADDHFWDKSSRKSGSHFHCHQQRHHRRTSKSSSYQDLTRAGEGLPHRSEDSEKDSHYRYHHHHHQQRQPRSSAQQRQHSEQSTAIKKMDTLQVMIAIIIIKTILTCRFIRRRNCKAESRTLLVSPTRPNFGDRTFHAAGPRVWNSADETQTAELVIQRF